MQDGSEYGKRVWVLANADPDVTGTLYWCGYKPHMKDHTWDRDPMFAVLFVRETDAIQAGVGALPAGVKTMEMEDGIWTGRGAPVLGSTRGR